MARIVITAAQIRFIKKNYLKMSASDIDRKYGVSEGVSSRWMKKNGYKVPKKVWIKFRVEKQRQATSSTPKVDRYLKNNYLKVPVNRMANTIGRSETFVKTRMRQLGLVTPRHIVRKFIKDSQIKKGNVPPNKGKKMPKHVYEKVKATMFKKGQLPANAIGFKDGDISVRLHNGKKAYKFIRLSRGVWYPYHQYQWERKHGKIPAGFCLWFKDGNSMNYNVRNLELISRKENMLRNSGALHLPDGYVAQTIAGRKSKHLYNEILGDKNLIDVKRLQILINRKIKSIQNGK